VEGSLYCRLGCDINGPKFACEEKRGIYKVLNKFMGLEVCLLDSYLKVKFNIILYVL
jgi:hypothetical protein